MQRHDQSGAAMLTLAFGPGHSPKAASDPANIALLHRNTQHRHQRVSRKITVTLRLAEFEQTEEPRPFHLDQYLQGCLRFGALNISKDPQFQQKTPLLYNFFRARRNEGYLQLIKYLFEYPLVKNSN